MNRVNINSAFACARTTTQISCAVTAQLINAFVFHTHIVLSLYFLNPKLQTSSTLLWLYSLVCVPGRKPRRYVSSRRGLSNQVHTRLRCSRWHWRCRGSGWGRGRLSCSSWHWRCRGSGWGRGRGWTRLRVTALYVLLPFVTVCSYTFPYSLSPATAARNGAWTPLTPRCF